MNLSDRTILRTGVGPCRYDEDKPKYKRCPVCDEKLAQGYLERGFHKLYRRGGEVVGCDVCMDEIDEYGEEYVA